MRGIAFTELSLRCLTLPNPGVVVLAFLHTDTHHTVRPPLFRFYLTFYQLFRPSDPSDIPEYPFLTQIYTQIISTMPD